MNSKHTSEEKQNIITAYKAGKRVSLLVTETGIPRSTIYAWLADERAKNSEKKTSFTLRARGLRQQRRGRHRGCAFQERFRHLQPWADAPEEPGVLRPAAENGT